MYRLVVAPRAKSDIAAFLKWVANYGEAKSSEFEKDIEVSIIKYLLQRPHTWPYFFLLGKPYRAYLYTVSRRTSFWLVFSIDEENNAVKLLRFWNSAQDPNRFVI